MLGYPVAVPLCGTRLVAVHTYPLTLRLPVAVSKSTEQAVSKTQIHTHKFR